MDDKVVELLAKKIETVQANEKEHREAIIARLDTVEAKIDVLLQYRWIFTGVMSVIVFLTTVGINFLTAIIQKGG